MLKKPSEYFKKDVTSVDNSVQELAKVPELNTFSDAFQSFKNNLSKIEVLSDFSETLDNYRVNIERVNHLSESIEDIKTEIQSLLKKEDLDRAMMSQLLVVEQSIRDVQSKVKGINEKNLTEIRLDVSGLTQSVNEFLEIDVPKYKKLLVDSELRTNARYEELEKSVNQTLEGVGDFVEEKYQHLTDTLRGINEDSLSGILEDFKLLEFNLQKIQEEDIPKYKGFIVETERKTEVKLNEFDEKLSSSLNIFEQELDQTVFSVLEKINLIETDKKELLSEVTEKINDVKNLSKKVSEELKGNEIYKKELKEKVADLEVNIIRNESHIRVQNKNLQTIQEEVKETLGRINLDEIEKQNYKLGKKVKYLEEIFEKFNEKEILTENIIVEPPFTDNSDPLTPLDQNFVTLDQLQNHYRLFINRIQQQLATFGGGGETQLKYLDDIVGIATNPSIYDGKFLKYDHSINKFEFVTVTQGGGGGGGSGESYWSSNSSGIHTTSNVGINTTNPTSKLYVDGDGYFTGVVTATSFGGNASSSTYATSSGIATYASTAGVATALQNTRTFEITGDIIASPITFDGTGNVSLAATIQPNSVALGGDTFGDYVQLITGTSNQINVSATSGAGSTPTLSIPNQFTVPQDLTVTRDLQVNRNLNVNGNITIGGTSATLYTQELKVFDPDIVLGIRTDANNIDISTDNTANHGGIAIASTEGTPLISLYDVGIGESNPATYKKFMWFKTGAFAGLGTDAWLSNYAIGIGSTQFPSGVRLAAGSVQFTENDLSAVRNIKASGIVSATSFDGNATSATYASTAGVATSVIINPGVGIATQGTTVGTGVTLLNFTGPGVSTVTVSSGIATITIPSSKRSSATYVCTEGETTFSATYDIGYVDVYLNGVKLSQTQFTALNGTSITLNEGASLGDIIEILSLTEVNVFSVQTNVSVQDEGNLVGVSITTFNFVGPNISASPVIDGISTITVTTPNYANLSGYSTSSGVSTSVIGGIGSVTQLSVSGISTFNSIVNVNDAIISNDTRLKSVSEKSTLVSGNIVNLVYNSGGGNIGICTNPTGDITLNITGIPTDSSFDNYTLVFSVILTQTGTARSCTAITLNGISTSIRWSGGSLSNAITGVTTSNGYDIYNFTAINTVGSASTVTNYQVLGIVNGGFR